MTYVIQMQTICGTEGGVIEAYATFNADTLAYAFERAQEQIAIDFGTVAPDALTIIIGKAPANGSS